MAEWFLHRKWDLKMGTPEGLSDWMQRLVDKEWGEKPEGIKETIDSLPVVGVSISLSSVVRGHDFGRNKVVVSRVLEFVKKRKGNVAVRSLYLHLLLGYLASIRGYLKNTKDCRAGENCTLSYYFDNFVGKDYVVTPTEEFKEELKKVLDFTERNEKKLVENLDLLF